MEKLLIIYCIITSLLIIYNIINIYYLKKDLNINSEILETNLEKWNSQNTINNAILNFINKMK